MKALIEGGKVKDIAEVEFEVHKAAKWVDAPVGTEHGDLFNGAAFTKPVAPIITPEPTELEILCDALKTKGALTDADLLAAKTKLKGA